MWIGLGTVISLCRGHQLGLCLLGSADSFRVTSPCLLSPQVMCSILNGNSYLLTGISCILRALCSCCWRNGSPSALAEKGGDQKEPGSAVIPQLLGTSLSLCPASLPHTFLPPAQCLPVSRVRLGLLAFAYGRSFFLRDQLFPYAPAAWCLSPSWPGPKCVITLRLPAF